MSTPTQTFEAKIVDFLQGQAPQSLDVIARRFPRFSRRTLQRRLKDLVERDIIVIEGAGRNTRYRYMGQAALESAPEHPPTIASGEDSSEIRHLIRRPLHERIPVSYDRFLLEGYRPNDTWYLDRAQREHLNRIGAVETENDRPAGTYARSILDRLLIDLSWASSRLEGNTYSRLDTKNLIELGQAAEGKDRTEAQMILNHKAAIEMLIDSAESVGYNRFTLFNLHAALADNLLHDPSEAGRLRTRIVQVSGTVFQPLSIPQELDRLFGVLLDKAEAIDDPFEQAFFVMVHLPYLQAFVDVNKRVSRLAANISMIKRNLVPLSFVDVPEDAYIEGTLGVYELGRVELLRDVFVWAYERSCLRYAAIKDTIREPDPMRLRYREHLSAVVGQMVRGSIEQDRSVVKRAGLAEGVDARDADTFVDMVLGDLELLHEGNISRYRIRLTEFEAWKKNRTG